MPTTFDVDDLEGQSLNSGVLTGFGATRYKTFSGISECVGNIILFRIKNLLGECENIGVLLKTIPKRFTAVSLNIGDLFKAVPKVLSGLSFNSGLINFFKKGFAYIERATYSTGTLKQTITRFKFVNLRLIIRQFVVMVLKKLGWHYE